MINFMESRTLLGNLELRKAGKKVSCFPQRRIHQPCDPVINVLEKWLVIGLIALSLFHAGQVAVAMATTSLSTDEFGTVGTFSSRGPARVVTDYRAPKNHIFFNLLNSILPGRDSLAPARVRALSILATLLAMAMVFAYTARRGQLFEGSVVVALWSLAPESLTLSMEARGYGFLGLFAVMGTIATMEYVRTGQHRWLWTLVAASVLGVYTVPSFLLFAGPLLFLLWAAIRSRETFVAGAATAALVLLLYAPVLRQVMDAFTGFHQDESVMEFSTVESLWRSVRLYLLPCDNWQAACILGALFLAPLVLASRKPPGERLAPCLVAAACAIYLGMLLLLRTPPLRVAAPVMLPAALVGILAIGAAVRAWVPSPRSSVVFIAASLALLVSAARAVWSFGFIPSENWTLAARTIDTAFPPTVKVDYARYAKYLKQTLPNGRARGAQFDSAAFSAGQLVVADAGNKWAEGRQFKAPDIPGLVEITIPGRIRDIVLTFRPPARTRLEMTDPSLLDANLNSQVSLAGRPYGLKFNPPPGARALVILLNQPATSRTLDVETSAAGAFIAGTAVIVPLSDKTPHPAEITLRPLVPGLAITEAWISL
jgi:hypothetical protein